MAKKKTKPRGKRKRPRKTLVKAGINKLISEAGKLVGRKKVVGKKTAAAVKKVKRGKAGKKTKIRAAHGVARAKTKPAIGTKKRHMGKVVAGKVVDRVYKRKKK